MSNPTIDEILDGEWYKEPAFDYLDDNTEWDFFDEYPILDDDLDD